MGYTMDTAPFKMSKASKMSAKVRQMLDCTFWDETLALASAMVLACQQNQDETKTKIIWVASNSVLRSRFPLTKSWRLTTQVSLDVNSGYYICVHLLPFSKWNVIVLQPIDNPKLELMLSVLDLREALLKCC